MIAKRGFKTKSSFEEILKAENGVSMASFSGKILE
jgi:hypothetical protein